jgi:hypothetical protein
LPTNQISPEPAEDDDDGDECASPVIDDDCPASDQETAPEPHRSLQITPPPLDPAKARPRAVIYVHLSEEALNASRGVARVEEVGPVLLSQLRMILGDHCSISVKPVIDLPAGHTAVDAYEIPASLREQILLRNPADAFPYAAAVSRSIDIDHTIPYLNPDKGGPPGQTRIGTSDPTPATTTGSKPTAAGRSPNPNPAPGSGAGSITLRTRADSYESDSASVMTRSARGKRCAISTALSWSVVRAQLSASSGLIPCCWWR